MSEPKPDGRSAKLIEGAVVKPLKVIPDERGFLMEILRADDEGERQPPRPLLL